MTDRPRLTEIAQEAWLSFLTPGDWTIDATAGNGHDTVFLAKAVSPKGRVFAFDVQEIAIRTTAKRLETEGLLASVTLIGESHASLSYFLPCSAERRIRLVCFNLGYLPTGNHALTTRPETTLPALRSSLALLAPGGALSIMAYRGHRGGLAEAEAVEAFVDELPAPWTCRQHIASGTPDRPGPVWWLVGRE